MSSHQTQSENLDAQAMQVSDVGDCTRPEHQGPVGSIAVSHRRFDEKLVSMFHAQIDEKLVIQLFIGIAFYSHY